jgi:hypothetical protein
VGKKERAESWARRGGAVGKKRSTWWWVRRGACRSGQEEKGGVRHQNATHISSISDLAPNSTSATSTASPIKSGTLPPVFNLSVPAESAQPTIIHPIISLHHDSIHRPDVPTCINCSPTSFQSSQHCSQVEVHISVICTVHRHIDIRTETNHVHLSRNNPFSSSSCFRQY